MFGQPRDFDAVTEAYNILLNVLVEIQDEINMFREPVLHHVLYQMYVFHIAWSVVNES